VRSRRDIRIDLILGAAVCLALGLAGSVGADRARFVAWKEPAAPPLALSDLAGQAHTLADYRDRVVLMNFWATWCEPCRAEMASIQKLQERLAGRPFTVLLVNYGEARARVADFANRGPIGATILLDPNQDAPRGVASSRPTFELPDRPGWPCALRRDRRDRLGERRRDRGGPGTLTVRYDETGGYASGR